MEEPYYPTTEELYEKFGKETVNGMFAEKEFNTILDNTIKQHNKTVLENFEDWSRFDKYDTDGRAFAAFMFIEINNVKQLEVCARLHISGKTYRKIRDEQYSDWITIIRQQKTQSIINARNLLALNVLGRDCPA